MVNTEPAGQRASSDTSRCFQLYQKSPGHAGPLLNQLAQSWFRSRVTATVGAEPVQHPNAIALQLSPPPAWKWEQTTAKPVRRDKAVVFHPSCFIFHPPADSSTEEADAASTAL